MSAAAPMELRHIPIDLIDEPALAMRETFDEHALAELAADIRANGLIQPLRVKPKGARVEVVAGHRRLLACRDAGMSLVPCLVVEETASSTERVKIGENRHRENVNAAEEASYYASVMEEHKTDDTDWLCDFVGQTRSYVESRLLLLRGHADVLAAVRRGELSISVAQALNKFPDVSGIAMHLDSAIAGATARQVDEWRRNYVLMIERNKDAINAGVAAGAALDAAPTPSGPMCECCHKRENMAKLTTLYVHDYCLLAILQPLIDAYYSRGESGVRA